MTEQNRKKFKICLQLNECDLPGEYVPPQESIRAFVKRSMQQSETSGTGSDLPSQLLDVAVRLMHLRQFRRLELVVPITTEELICEAERQEREIATTEQEGYWHT